MTIQQQVSSLELSKKLKELGVPQKSLFHWVCRKNKAINLKVSRSVLMNNLWELSAFTVAELGEMLPREFTNDGSIWELRQMKNAIGWDIGYAEWPKPKDERIDVSWFVNISSETEADARAKLIIYLLENNLLKP